MQNCFLCNLSKSYAEANGDIIWKSNIAVVPRRSGTNFSFRATELFYQP